MRRKIYLIIFNIFVFFVFAELLANIIYFYNTGQIFYTSEERIPASEKIPETQRQGLPRLLLHPYFGFTERGGFVHPVFTQIPELSNTGFVANNYGFHSQFDYPFIKNNDNQYIIGVFGGSVSTRFVIQGQEQLIQKLKTNPFFKNKQIVVLSFGNGGYKQPQQLQVLTYFLSIGQTFDFVINIDGFNEVALSNINNQYGINIYMPSASHILPLITLTNQNTLSPEKLNSLSKIIDYQKEFDRLETHITKTHLAFLGFFLQQLYKIKYTRYKQELINFQELASKPSENSLVYLNHEEEPLNDNNLFNQISQNWYVASVLMNNILEAQGIPYIHILQPNQYYSKKLFTEQELAHAINENSPYRRAVEKGYPVLEEKSVLLKQAEVKFFNGVELFDNVSETIYLDDCCHYNQLGNDILADFIATAILESIPNSDGSANVPNFPDQQ